jgi:hypothetical protein
MCMRIVFVAVVAVLTTPAYAQYAPPRASPYETTPDGRESRGDLFRAREFPCMPGECCGPTANAARRSQSASASTHC